MLTVSNLDMSNIMLLFLDKKNPTPNYWNTADTVQLKIRFDMNVIWLRWTTGM